MWGHGWSILPGAPRPPKPAEVMPAARALAARIAALEAAHGDRVRGVAGDVRSLADNQAAVSAAEQAFGALDCAIGNAGVWDYSTALVDLPDGVIDAAFDELFSVNVKGYLLLAKAAAPALVRSEGALLFTVSNAGFYPGGWPSSLDQKG